MEILLYAEVYLICIIFVGIVAIFEVRYSSNSASDRWFKVLLAMFLLNFVSNFLFKLVNGGVIVESPTHEAGYALKTLYHITLCLGVFAWCGYADSEQGSGVFQRRGTLKILLIPLAVPLVLVLANLQTHALFEITESGAYVRGLWFQLMVGYLVLFSGIMSVRLVARTGAESDPSQRSHMYLTASFPLCIAAAWVVSFVGEAFPVICVCVTVEILCLYIGGARNEVSMDKLTQVNNRQNLIGFMDYKARQNNGNLYLLMIDIDEFKQVNDTYGHLEGDAALVTVAGILKRACGPFPRRPYIARYGGDEFIVIAELSDHTVDELVSAINAELDRVNAGRDTYKLMLSIGVMHWEPGAHYKEVIDKADAEMYTVKRKRREAREASRSQERTREAQGFYVEG